MDGVRVVGQRMSHGRCAYCLEDIVEDVEPCSVCGLLTHDTCRTELGRCPTFGCGTPEAERVRVQVDVARERGARRALASLGPYAQLLFAPAILLLPAAFMGFLSFALVHDAIRLSELTCFVPWLLASAVIVFAFFKSVTQSLSRGATFQRLLAQDEPSPMRMLLTEPGLRFTLILQPIGGGPQIVYRNPSLPGWVNERAGEQVYVHGVGGGGPYVLEFEDGRLALLGV